jgi:hypothetical protein
MTLEELEAEAMRLDPSERAELIRRLSAGSGDSATAAEVSPPSAPVSAPAAVTPEASAPSASPVPAAPPEISDDERERLWLQDAMRRSRELRAAQPPPAERGASFLPLLEGEVRDERAPSSRRPRPRAQPVSASRPPKSRARAATARKRPAKSKPKPKPKPKPRPSKRARPARPRTKPSRKPSGSRGRR